MFLFLISAISALNPIVIKGSKFFDSKTGDQFFIKGVAYQPGGSGFEDPLSKADDCKRDIKYFKDLGINTLRVYETYTTNSHDDCMKLLADAGIYVMLDLPNPKISVNRNNPNYNLELFNHFKSTVDSFSKYDNILGFFAGNEVNNSVNNTNANPFVKASLRDIKVYIKSNSKRPIPVGYANNDDADTRENIENYFNCGTDEERADFFGVNIYRWCGKSTFQESGYDLVTKGFSGYTIPVILSEYGCNTIPPRTFGDVQSLYGPDMQDVFSGGIAYEFTNEANNFGLVKLSGNNVETLPDFDTLKTQLASVNPKGVNMNNFQGSSDAAQCPSAGNKWEASTTLPPIPSQGACDCMQSTLKCVVNSSFNVTKNGDKVGELFGYLCANGADCDKSLKQDGSKGSYGTWGSCTITQQLSWAFNEVYNKNGGNADSCTSGGVAQVTKPTKSDVSQCTSIKADLSSGSGSGKGGKSNSNLFKPSLALALSTFFFFF